MLYFAFGSNLSVAQMRVRCPGSEPVGPALLRGRRLGFAYRSQNFPPGGAADVVESAGGEVWGALYRLTDRDLEELDRFEFVGAGGYRQVTVEVEQEGKMLPALCYEVVDRLESDLAPIAGYRRLMIEGAREHGLPQAWIDSLELRFRELDRPRTA